MTYGEKKALGWDETIKPCEEGDDRYYLIKSRKDTYKTLEVLADYGADALTGRGTRVYKVERQSDKKVCVLKDVWVDEDRDPEDVIYKNILESATDPEDRQFLEDHLLKPTDHWAVAVNEGKTEEEDEKDHTIHVMMHSETPPEPDQTLNLVSKVEGSNPNANSVAPLMSFDAEPNEKTRLATRVPARKGFSGRKHYRIVFEQVATPVYKLTNLSTTFLVLKDAAKGTVMTGFR